MGRYDETRRRAVFDKTRGICHLCHKRIAFANYGVHEACGGWEIDHSVPRSLGGTDHLNNLYAAHTSCNRSKQAQSSRRIRLGNGQTRPPLSAEAIERERLDNALTGAFSFGLLGARFAGPAGFWIGAIVGAVATYAIDPEA
jgi:5-methylcytosine-specific restriction endonuclease McrA